MKKIEQRYTFLSIVKISTYLENDNLQTFFEIENDLLADLYL